MNGRTKTRKIAVIMAGVVAASIVAAFAIVSNRPSEQNKAFGSLGSVVESAKTWEASFPEWSAKKAPDFAVTDLDGVEHRLGDYRGKNVLLIFWATWCPACNAEIPHLIDLREEFNEDELVILAISNESGEQLKKFTASKGINYTVASLGGVSLPRPYADVTSIPTSFFIDKDGNIKLVALGLVPLEDSRAILKAEL